MKCYRRLLLIATAVVLVMGVTGCSGITASPSISPATFLLPGLGDASPAVEDVPATSETPRAELALAR
ncbi:MAG: hypothetical protein H7A46_10405 [Verrucomicrobiales bacterium]|nr:hypothetical protein [Verrucomicrobiales bacterium]